MKTGIELIAQERQHQIEKHGFTGEHHANHPECREEKSLLLFDGNNPLCKRCDGLYNRKRKTEMI